MGGSIGRCVGTRYEGGGGWGYESGLVVIMVVVYDFMVM